MMNDSRSARIGANKITENASPKSAKMNKITRNKRWLKDGLRKSPPKEALTTQTTLLTKKFAEKNNWAWGSSTKHYKKKEQLPRELWSAEKKGTNQKKKCKDDQIESLKRSRQWRSTITFQRKGQQEETCIIRRLRHPSPLCTVCTEVNHCWDTRSLPHLMTHSNWKQQDSKNEHSPDFMHGDGISKTLHSCSSSRDAWLSSTVIYSR